MAASTRLVTPSLLRMFETCSVAVFGLMNSVSAICRFVRPVATRARTSCSRAVSPSRASGDGGSAAIRVAASVLRLRRPRRARPSISMLSGWAPKAVAVAYAVRSDASARLPGDTS